MWRRLRLGSFGLRILASFGALGAQMKQTYEGPGEGCRSSVQHCDSFRGRMLHPGQAQPETWSFGSLLFVHERASVSAGAGVMMEERGRDGGSSDGIGAVVREGTLEDCGKEVVKHAGMCWSGVLEVARSHAWTSWEHEGQSCEMGVRQSVLQQQSH